MIIPILIINFMTKKYILVTTTEVGVDLSMFKLFYIDKVTYQQLKDNSFDDSFDNSFTVIGGINFNDENIKLISQYDKYDETDVPINFDVDTVFYDKTNEYNLKLPKDNKKIIS